MKNKCTNCNKEIVGMGVMSPTLKKKRTNMCLDCAKKFYTYPELEDLKNKPEEWEIEFEKQYHKYIVDDKGEQHLNKDYIKITTGNAHKFIQELLDEEIFIATGAAFNEGLTKGYLEGTKFIGKTKRVWFMKGAASAKSKKDMVEYKK